MCTCSGNAPVILFLYRDVISLNPLPVRCARRGSCSHALLTAGLSALIAELVVTAGAQQWHAVRLPQDDPALAWGPTPMETLPFLPPPMLSFALESGIYTGSESEEVRVRERKWIPRVCLYPPPTACSLPSQAFPSPHPFLHRHPLLLPPHTGGHPLGIQP